MKIIFLGTPEFAVPSLKLIHEAGYDIPAVITAPDKPAGRGRHLKFSAVKEYALSAGLKLLQPLKLNDPEFLEEVRQLNADLQIVVAFRMMPEKLWSMPPSGTFNLHGSLLPQYRGAAPINRAVMNGEKETGLTTFFLKHEIDTGNIIFRKKIEIGPDETAGELHDRMMTAGASLVLETVKAIEQNNVHALPQSDFIEEDLKEAPKIFRDDCRMDFKNSIYHLHNQVRGLSPSPGAFFEIETDTGEIIPVKVIRSRPEPAGVVLTHELITDKNDIRISADDGFLHLLELQIPGKKVLKAQELMRGFEFKPDWKVL